MITNKTNVINNTFIKSKLQYNENVTSNSYEEVKLRKYFPQYFEKDGKFNFEKFKSMLDYDNIPYTNNDFLQKESFSLNFVGKKFSQIITGKESITVITPDIEHNNKSENINSENIYIKGDNLDALKHMLNSYENKIKCIYIDPPYNTGKEFVYTDNFKYNKANLIKIGLTEEEAERVENLYGKATHSAWLSFMLPRLSLAKDLLTDDGIIFISIDDNEVNNLKMLCNEIFGELNFIAQIVIDGTPKNDPYIVSTAHEYCLVYTRNFQVAKDTEYGVSNPLYNDLLNIYNKNGNNYEQTVKDLKKFFIDNNLTDDNISNYKYADKYGIYRTGPIDDPQGGGSKDKRINPKTGQYCMTPSAGWRCNKSTWNEWVKQNLIEFPNDDTKLPAKKTYVTQNRLDVMRAYFKVQTRKDTDMLKRMFGEDATPFSNPKPLELIKTFIENTNDKNAIILDFFSGSATTAHAVLKQNALDLGLRKFILVQLPEKIELKSGQSNKEKKITQAALSFLRKNNLPENICSIGIERIKKSADMVKKETNADIDYGFKIYEINNLREDSLNNIISFDETINKIYPDDYREYFKFNNINGEETILQTWKVDDGYGFNMMHKEINLGDMPAYLINKTLYLINPTTDNFVKILIEQLEHTLFDINRIILFGYSYTLTQQQELHVNIKNYNNAKNQNDKIKFEVRY